MNCGKTVLPERSLNWPKNNGKCQNPKNSNESSWLTRGQKVLLDRPFSIGQIAEKCQNPNSNETYWAISGLKVLPDRSILIGQKLMKNANIEKIQMRQFEQFSNNV